MQTFSLEIFMSHSSFAGQYGKLLKQDYIKHGRKSPERFAKKILSHDYSDKIAKQFRDYVRCCTKFERED